MNLVHRIRGWFDTPESSAVASDYLSLSQSRELARYDQLSRRLARVGLGCLVVLFVWAWLTPVPQAALGTGKVVPSQRLQIVQVVDGGILTGILVGEGDFVEKNQIIAQIDTTRFSSSLQEKEAVEATLRLREERLNALLDGTDFEPP
ncbi:MAG: biotin/lipoyl-binding protein, partial [Limnobacter sp.]|nr:biotin/lipoyl-binding protein [Limnobacter sp.]